MFLAWERPPIELHFNSIHLAIGLFSHLRCVPFPLHHHVSTDFRKVAVNVPLWQNTKFLPCRQVKEVYTSWELEHTLKCPVLPPMALTKDLGDAFGFGSWFLQHNELNAFSEG